jgi:uncharacterized protein
VTKPLVLYHKGCPDGSGAAYAAWLHLGDDAEYRPVNYGDDALPDEHYRDRLVYVVDFSFKRPECERVARLASKLVIVDHHKTAKADLEGVDWPSDIAEKIHVTFDMEHSGAALTYQHFVRMTLWDHLPEIFKYVEDRDLWKWKLKDSKEVSAAMRALGVVEDFRKFGALPSTEILVQMGSAILLYERSMVKSICAQHREMDFRLDSSVYSVPVVNSPVLQSEVGHELCQGKPFAAVWYQSRDRKLRVSLRSDDKGEDVSRLAKLMGGGGHARAAGFETELPLEDVFIAPVEK